MHHEQCLQVCAACSRPSTRHSTLCSFILKAVGPGLVVPAMFQLQKTGLGKDQGKGWRDPNMLLLPKRAQTHSMLELSSPHDPPSGMGICMPNICGPHLLVTRVMLLPPAQAQCHTLTMASMHLLSSLPFCFHSPVLRHSIHRSDCRIL